MNFSLIKIKESYTVYCETELTNPKKCRRHIASSPDVPIMPFSVHERLRRRFHFHSPSFSLILSFSTCLTLSLAHSLSLSPSPSSPLSRTHKFSLCLSLSLSLYLSIYLSLQAKSPVIIPPPPPTKYAAIGDGIRIVLSLMGVGLCTYIATRRPSAEPHWLSAPNPIVPPIASTLDPNSS